MNYLINTTATMKEYNNKKWWIDSRIIPTLTINASDMGKALREYQKIALEKYYIAISDNALKRKKNMYIDTENGPQQTGFVITARTDFENNYKWVAQYIDLWVDIQIVKNPFAEV